MSPSTEGSTSIRSITDRPSLAPSSSTRRPMGASCEALSAALECAVGERRAYHVPPLSQCGLGRVSSPVVRQLRQRSSEPPVLTTYLLVQAIQHLALGLCNDDCDASRELTDTTPSWFPTPLMLGVASSALRPRSPSLARRGYVVTGASHERVTPNARPGRRPRAVPRVMSLHESA
jgi:hypothetical protein